MGFLCLFALLMNVFFQSRSRITLYLVILLTSPAGNMKTAFSLANNSSTRRIFSRGVAPNLFTPTKIPRRLTMDIKRSLTKNFTSLRWCEILSMIAIASIPPKGWFAANMAPPAVGMFSIPLLTTVTLNRLQTAAQNSKLFKSFSSTMIWFRTRSLTIRSLT